MILLLYVDDILIASNFKLEINKVKGELNREFEMKDLGAISKILGMEIKRNRRKGTLKLSQESYLKKVLEKFGMTKLKLVITSLSQQFKLSANQVPKTTKEVNYMDNVQYANLVGLLCMLWYILGLT